MARQQRVFLLGALFVSVMLLSGCGRDTATVETDTTVPAIQAPTSSNTDMMSGTATGVQSNEDTGTPTDAQTPVQTGSSTGTTSSTKASSKTIVSDWKSYKTPRGEEQIKVTAVIDTKTNKITDVKTEYVTNEMISKRFQGLFSEGIAAQVVGKDLKDAHVGIVNGSSLTGEGFNQAIDEIAKNYNAS